MGWFFVTIILPLVAPLGLMLLLWALPLPVNVTNTSLLTPIKDGQLCWGAIGFCASALYEIAVPTETGMILAPAYAGYFNAGFIILLVMSSLLAAGGAVFPTALERPIGVSWPQHYKNCVVSLLLTEIAAAAYVVVHWGLLRE